MGAGRPPMYNSAEEMQVLIDKYFDDCQGTILKDKDGNIVYNKYGIPIRYNEKPPTVTGLALALGFNCRLSLLNYQGKEEFVNTITRAKAKVEAYAESRLFDKDGANGAKFSLANNFKGWTEKQEVTANNTNINTDAKSMFDMKATEEEKSLMSQGKLTGEQIQEILRR